MLQIVDENIRVQSMGDEVGEVLLDAFKVFKESFSMYFCFWCFIVLWYEESSLKAFFGCNLTLCSMFCYGNNLNTTFISSKVK